MTNDYPAPLIRIIETVSPSVQQYMVQITGQFIIKVSIITSIVNSLNHEQIRSFHREIKYCLKFFFDVVYVCLSFKFLFLRITRTTIVVSNGRYTFYQIQFIKYHLQSNFFLINE